MKKLWRKLATLAAAVVAAFGAFSAPVTAYAEESETVATSVMEDLQTDATFSADNYPGKTIAELKSAGEEYLQVIKIGESVNNELYVYVYQPTDAEKEIEAKKILIGQTANESAASVYSLKLVSTDGVFDKYLVDGLNVLASFDVRHYQITSLYRPFDTALDEEQENGGKDTYIAVPVAQTWYARNVDGGGIEYAHTYDEVITITDEWHGSFLYWSQLMRFTQSFFLAFTTDRKIDSLKSVEMTYAGKNVVYVKKTFGDEWRDLSYFSPKYLKITETQKGSNNASGFFDKYYEWDRISEIDSFINENELNADAIQNLNRVKETAKNNGTTAFVLRYIENEVYVKTGSQYGGIGYAEAVEVTDVTLLKLTFETAGVPYTMGVIDSMTTPDTIPDGKHDLGGIEGLFKEGFNDLERNLRLISLSIGAIILMGAIALIVFWITRLVKWIRESKGSG